MSTPSLVPPPDKVDEKKFSINDAVELPLFGNPRATSDSGVPTEYVRRMEESQRVFEQLNIQQSIFTKAYNDSVFTLGVQTGWLFVGSWVFYRGAFHADPYYSVVRGLTENVRVRRAFTPLSCLGLGIVGMTLWQLPTDYSILLESTMAWNIVEKDKMVAIAAKELALTEGMEAASKAAATTGDAK